MIDGLSLGIGIILGFFLTSLLWSWFYLRKIKPITNTFGGVFGDETEDSKIDVVDMLGLDEEEKEDMKSSMEKLEEYAKEVEDDGGE